MRMHAHNNQVTDMAVPIGNSSLARLTLPLMMHLARIKRSRVMVISLVMSIVVLGSIGWARQQQILTRAFYLSTSGNQTPMLSILPRCISSMMWFMPSHSHFQALHILSGCNAFYLANWSFVVFLLPMQFFPFSSMSYFHPVCTLTVFLIYDGFLSSLTHIIYQ